MAAVASQLQGTSRFIEQLEQKIQALHKGKAINVTVGYNAYYAIYVHEDLQKHHPTGQAKFLEEPARRLAPQMARTVSYYLGRGYTLEQAMLIAGLDLQKESQRLVPVDTGFLRDSAYTRVSP